MHSSKAAATISNNPAIVNDLLNISILCFGINNKNATLRVSSRPEVKCNENLCDKAMR